MAPFAVYADDYTYIPINDIEQYNAYKFFELYGYQLDYTNTVSYTISESGNYTYTGRVTGSLNGGHTSSFNATISSGISSTLTENDGITYQGNGNIFGFGAVTGDSFTLDLVPEDTSTEYTATPMVCRATSASQQFNDDWEYNEYTCTSTGVNGEFTLPEYKLELGSINIDQTQAGVIRLHLSETGTTGGGISGTLNLNTSLSETGSGSITLNGNITTTGHRTYQLPELTVTNINNSKNTIKRFRVNNNNHFVIIFLSNSTSYFNAYTNVKKYSDDSIHNEYIHRLQSSLVYLDGYTLQGIEIYGDGNNELHYLEITSNMFNNIIPLYVGFKNNISDDLYRFVYGDDRTDQLLENGNSNSKQAITNNESMTNSFSQASQGMHSIENTWENNLDTNMQNIPTSSSMYNDNKFIATANWVRNQFERIVLNTPFELLLVFSLILGIALVLIGKVR